MKKNIFILFIMVAISTASNAQDVIYGGLRLAPNYSFFNQEVKVGDKTVNSGIGYSIGYFEVLELSNKINLQAELNYNTISFKHDITDGSVTYRNTNLELPLMVKYRVAESFAIGVGYQFNLFNKEVGSAKQITKVKNVKESEDGEVVKTAGFFVDASLKAGSNIVGLRVLSTKFSPAGDGLLGIGGGLGGNPILDQSALNVSLYVGFTIFK